MGDGDGAVGLDPNDPDAIAACPPAKAIDAKTFFQVGLHEGKWSEYDERGVPVKNIKKKKPTKKEKEGLESEYLDASKAYQKYLKDVENWEQSKLDSEKQLKKADRLRWAFRQVGQKHEPISPDELETIIKLMGWKALSGKEFRILKKGLGEIASFNGQVELEALRVFVRDVMPIALLEERLMSEQLDSIELEDLYSPRTWRRKVAEDPPPKKQNKSSPRGKTSPRLSGRRSSTASARGGKKDEDTKMSPRGGKTSPRMKGKSKSKLGGDMASPRGR